MDRKSPTPAPRPATNSPDMERPILERIPAPAGTRSGPRRKAPEVKIRDLARPASAPRGWGITGSVAAGLLLLALVGAGGAAAASPADVGYSCVAVSHTGATWLWTPVILLNSPYGGSAVGVKTITTSSSFDFYVVGWTSTSEQASGISATNGQAKGLFELDEWTVYNLQTEAHEGGGGTPCTASHSAGIIATSDTTTTQQLLPAGDWFDVGEVSSFTFNDHHSVTFANDFIGTKDPTGTEYSCSPPNYAYTESTQESSIGGGISVNLPLGDTSITLSGTMSMSSTTSYAFTYTYSSVGTYEWQTLDGSYDHGALAFAYTPGC